MATRNSDVTLVIKARDEAQKTLDAISSALERLSGNQQTAGKSGGDLASIIAALDKGYAALAGTAKTAESAFAGQKSAIAAQKSELKALQDQAASAAAVLAKLNSAESIVNAGRDQSGRLATVKLVTQEYDRLTAAQTRLATSIATQENALGNSVSSLQRIGSTANAVEAAVATARAQLDRETASLEKNTAAAAANAAVKPRIEAVTGVNRSAATSNGATFSALDARENGFVQAAAGLRAQLDPVADIEARLVIEQGKLNALFHQGHINAAELGGGLKLLRGSADNAIKALSERPKVSLFGLKPYETQNLIYQINDVITGFASGQHAGQILAQQGGQILQLFQNRIAPTVIAALSSGPILGFIAALGVMAIAINRAADNAERLRTLGAIFTVNADGANYQSQAVLASEKAMQRLGMTAEDTLGIVKVALKEGFNQEQIVGFGAAAEHLAEIMGIKVVDAAQQLATAFSGDLDSILALDKQTNIYTASQLALIRQLFEQGKAHDAVAMAAGIAFGKLDEGAAKAKGPWSESMKSLTTAWSGFLDTLANSAVIQRVLSALETLANGATDVMNSLSGAQTVDGIDRQIAQLETLYGAYLKIVDLNGKHNRYAPRDNAPAPAVLAVTQLNKLRDERDAALAKLNGAASPGNSVNSEARAKADAALADAAERRLATETKITTQAQLQARLAQIRKDALIEAGRREPLSDDAARAKFADAAVNAAKTGLQTTLDNYIKAQNAAAATMTAQTVALLKSAEGFVGKAHWDRNAYRVGYGSDTTTDANGRPSAVTPSTTVTEAGALRDLERRVKEFSDTVKRQVGADRYNAFSAPQQAALNSIAYNYGSLPERILHAVRTGSAQEIAAAVRSLGGDNGGINRKRRNREAGILESTPNTELDASTQNIAEQRLDAQKKFNDAIDDENEKRRLSIAALTAENGLQGEALIAEQRKATIAAAVLAKQQEIDRLNADRAKQHLDPLEFTSEQVDAIKATTAALFDLAHARDVAAAKRRAVEEPVRDLSAQREAVGRQIDLAQQSGLPTGGLEATYKSLTAQINAALDAQIALVEAIIAGGDKAAEMNGGTVAGFEAQAQALRNAKVESQQLGRQATETGRQINQSLASGITNAFDQFAQSVAEGKNVFASLGQAFLKFAADFLRQIALMIIEQVAFNAVSGGQGGSGGGGAGGSISSFIGKLFHDGGVVGSGGAPRAVSPAWYGNALRYHSGGIAGLQPDEVPAVLRRGEEVLTAADPRHRANGGGAAGGRDVKVVNVFNQEQAIKEMLSTRAGEDAMLNVVTNNPAAFKAAMG